MRVVYREKGENKAELEIHGETHTVLNLLTNYLNKNLGKGYSAYKIEHPLKQNATLFINASSSPRPLLVKTLKELIKDLETLEERFNRLLEQASGKTSV
ncbi:MAG: RpoL/Rpb11 RNA polymerase subunit family protein [Thermoproteota archaeon]